MISLLVLLLLTSGLLVRVLLGEGLDIQPNCK